MEPEQKNKRCAIYTRKSVEEGLEMEFNSLDAQREACEAYITSQKPNGWVCLSKHYDDGGVSGGTLDRPALKELLDDAKNGKIDIIVIYKLDRLSRSICDFAELSKMFDEWGVSFVSVTQEINTSTSAGRMMLNILITFAQYEREVIAERIRDKMSASRKRGQWVGGTFPYGYHSENHRLVPIPELADNVVMMYDMFLREGSLSKVVHNLNRMGIKTKKDRPWTKCTLARLLENHTYVGEVFYKGEVYPGEHEALVSREVWDAVQELLKKHRHGHQKGRPSTIRYALLTGLIRCGHCNGPMTPTSSKRWGRTHFYYNCFEDSKRETHQCPVRIVRGLDIEKAVVKQIGLLFSTTTFMSMVSTQSGVPIEEVKAAFKDIDSFWNELFQEERIRLLKLLVKSVIVKEDGISITIKTEGMRSLIKELQQDDQI